MFTHRETRADIERLHDNRLFAGIPENVIEEISTEIEWQRFEENEVVFEEGDEGECLYLVIGGQIRISKTGRGGQQETLGVMHPGNFFGEMALIDGQARSAQASAAQPTVLGRLDTASFHRVLESAPRDLHMNFLRCVVERLRGINSHFITEVMRSERLSLVGSMANSIIHDLRNPIQSIQSCSELIGLRTQDPTIIQFTDIMQRAVGNMMDMVEELLDFARGKSSLEFKRIPAKAVIDELDQQLIRLLPERVHLVREIGTCGEISVDSGRFVRVLLNLIKNSIDAMPKGGALRLVLRQEGRRCIFRIADTGIGIPPELLCQIFEPFVTYGKSKGTGLGMAIAKSVVEAHGGTIGIRSAVGVGTTVEISIPTLDLDIAV